MISDRNLVVTVISYMFYRYWLMLLYKKNNSAYKANWPEIPNINRGIGAMDGVVKVFYYHIQPMYNHHITYRSKNETSESLNEILKVEKDDTSMPGKTKQ